MAPTIVRQQWRPIRPVAFGRYCFPFSSFPVFGVPFISPPFPFSWFPCSGITVFRVFRSDLRGRRCREPLRNEGFQEIPVSGIVI